MNDIDKTIGANLLRFRADLSQQDLALRMRDKGFKWSQATVWAIEKGERPLRLSEAVEVAQIFGVTIEALAGISSTNDLVIPGAGDLPELAKATLTMMAATFRMKADEEGL